MSTKTETFNQSQVKKDIPDIRSGDTVRIYQKTEEKGKEKSQIFEGLVIARKHGKGVSGTITVRRVISGIGVEKIFPVHSPVIEKIEIIKRSRVKRAKLYFLRKAKGKRGKLKKEELSEAIVWEEPKEKSEEIKKETSEETEEKIQEKEENPQKESAPEEESKKEN